MPSHLRANQNSSNELVGHAHFIERISQVRAAELFTRQHRMRVAVARDLIETAGSVDKAWARFYRRAGVSRAEFRRFAAGL